MFSLLGLVAPIMGFFTRGVATGGAAVTSFFGSPRKGKNMLLVLILLGLLVLVPQMAKKRAEHNAKEAAERAAKLEEDLQVSDIERQRAEEERDAERVARQVEKQNFERTVASSTDYLAQKSTREATIEKRLKELTNALNARKTGDAAAGDSAVILRNLGKVGVESAGAGGGGSAAPIAAGPMHDNVGPSAIDRPDAKLDDGTIGGSPDVGIRATAEAGGQ